MDDKDKTLLRELQADSERPKKEIAKIVGLAGNTLTDRIKKLWADGYIRRIGAVLHPAKVGLPTTVFFLGKFANGVKVTTEKLTQIVEQERKIGDAQISEVHTLLGEFDVLIKVRAKDTAALEAMVNMLEEKAKIKTQTLVVSTSVLENAGVVLDDDKPDKDGKDAAPASAPAESTKAAR